jgi:hypothetical protein
MIGMTMIMAIHNGVRELGVGARRPSPERRGLRCARDEQSEQKRAYGGDREDRTQIHTPGPHL